MVSGDLDDLRPYWRYVSIFSIIILLAGCLAETKKIDDKFEADQNNKLPEPPPLVKTEGFQNKSDNLTEEKGSDLVAIESKNNQNQSTNNSSSKSSPKSELPSSKSEEKKQNTRLNGKYIMAFHVCESCEDPRAHITYVAQSNDSINWYPILGYVPKTGSVPEVIRRNNTLYIFNPGIIRRYQIDQDVWEEPTVVTIKTSDGSQRLFVDPSAIVDNEGKLVLFYLVGQLGGDPARCLSSENSCTKVFRSATEVKGSNGKEFLEDDGERVRITISQTESASDPDIFYGDSKYMLYISRGPSVEVLSSTELRGSYVDLPQLPQGMLVKNLGGIPAGYFDITKNEYWTYVHSNSGQYGQLQIIRRASHKTFEHELKEQDFSTVITGSNFGLGSTYSVASPSIALNKNNLE